MSEVKQKLIDELKKIGKVNFVKKFEEPKDAFAYYFSILDINGIDSVLSNQNNYDGITKLEYLDLIREHFISLKNNDIYALKAYSGVCNGCKNGCSGFTFLDDSKGFFSDIIIEIKDSEIVNFMECFNMVNEVDGLNKIEQLTVKPFKLESDNFDVPF
jgi:hypothetical protein